MIVLTNASVFVCYRDDKNTRELRAAEAQVANLEAKVADLQKNYNQAQGDRKKLTDENKVR